MQGKAKITKTKSHDFYRGGKKGEEEIRGLSLPSPERE